MQPWLQCASHRHNTSLPAWWRHCAMTSLLSYVCHYLRYDEHSDVTVCVCAYLRVCIFYTGAVKCFSARSIAPGQLAVRLIKTAPLSPFLFTFAFECHNPVECLTQCICILLRPSATTNGVCRALLCSHGMRVFSPESRFSSIAARKSCHPALAIPRSWVLMGRKKTRGEYWSRNALKQFTLMLSLHL